VRRIIAWTSLTAALVTTAAVAGDAGEVVEIRLRGHYFSEPATVQITVAIEPAKEHRSLVIEADGERYFRSSELTLSGETDKRLHSIEFKNLPAGAYILRAEVHSSEDVLATATQDLVVTGVGGR
jgi:hypothetical protein